MKEKLKQKNGITLIALVVTIIVLLILAGISIGAMTGDNGIINQAHNAKEDTERSSWEEQIDVAIIDAESKNIAPDIDDVIGELINKDVIDKEEQVNKETGAITTNEPTYTIEGKLDDYITKIEISITKINLPDDQNVSDVLLIVDKVLQNGSELSETMKLTEEEYGNILIEKLEAMTEEEKESIFVELVNISEEMNFSDINELIEYMVSEGIIADNTKDALYEFFGVKENFDSWLASIIYNYNYNLIGEYDKETGELQRYTVTNPDGENSNIYLATTNGDYTFKVEIDGIKYTKTVNVNNITTNQDSDSYSVENIDAGTIGLKDIENDVYTTFSNAYIVYNNEAIDISNYIINENGMSMIYGQSLEEIVGSQNYGVVTDVILIKNNQSYMGKVEIKWPI